MKQQTLTGFERFAKTTRRAQFLSDMDRILPWSELVAVVEPVYPKVSELGGRPPMPLERMLRIHFLQLWFNLSDPAVEEALYDSVAMRSFAGIDLGAEAAPDETTVCKFRHLLEKHKLGKRLLVAVNEYLRRNGIKIANGTIVDATIISAPSSTKNKDGERDPEMHQTAKGQQWYFGMKAHFGVDSKTKLIHTVLASAANVADVEALPYLLHGRETRVWGDQAYTGRTTTIRARAPRARDFTNRKHRGRGWVSEVAKAKNRVKSKVRAKVEHVIGVIKRIFGFQKVRYRGLAKNLHRLEAMAALTNIYMVRRRLPTA
ncbi:MAG: IS5 family transposase [Gammaproteobacteria bacterium]|nr:IS5 family transposase [Gammaproteobacteria bacterium]